MGVMDDRERSSPENYPEYNTSMVGQQHHQKGRKLSCGQSQHFRASTPKQWRMHGIIGTSVGFRQTRRRL